MRVCQILMGHLLLVPEGEPGFQIRHSCQRMLIKQALCALQPPAKPQTLLSAAQSTSTPHQRAYYIPARRLQGWTGISTPSQQKCKLLPYWAFCKQMQIAHGIQYLHTFEKDIDFLRAFAILIKQQPHPRKAIGRTRRPTFAPS